MALPCVRFGGVQLRAGALYRSLCRRSSSHAAATTAEEIDIPRRKTWDKTAVLQALAYTVSYDPTAAPYILKDDVFLTPRSSKENRIFTLSKESGKNTAKYVVNMYPHLFQKDFAEPHIPCLMPESITPQIEGVSEEALNERVKLRRVKESVDLFDQLLQGGTTPSLETTNRLLDLVCFYGDREPAADDQPDEQDDESEVVKKKSFLQQNNPAVKIWRKGNNAERIFNLMPEKNAHSYCTMIRGMVKHGAYAQAFNMYTDLLNNRLSGDVYTFNALILAAPYTTSNVKKTVVILELLNHMAKQNVTPNLLTFNSVMKSLREIGTEVEALAKQTLKEMKALHIEPSFATYTHYMRTIYKSADVAGQSQLLASILDEVQGKTMTAKDPDDALFFSEAMNVCFNAKDLDLMYELHKVLNTGDNWRLLGKRFHESYYYGKFFQILCMMQNVDVVLKWYRELVPSRYYPNGKCIENLLQLLEMENRLEIIPELWKDIKQLGLSNQVNLVEEFVRLMASRKQNAELQDAFADTAASIISMYESSNNLKKYIPLSAAVFGNTAIVLSRAGRLEEAWKVLQSFKTKGLIPGSNVITELLDGARAAGNSAMAVDLVQLAALCSLSDTAQSAQQVLNDFTLTEEQRIILQDLTPSSGTSNSSSSSSSDSDRD